MNISWNFFKLPLVRLWGSKRSVQTAHQSFTHTRYSQNSCLPANFHSDCIYILEREEEKKYIKKAWRHQVKRVIAVIISCGRWLINHQDFHHSLLFMSVPPTSLFIGLSPASLLMLLHFVCHSFLDLFFLSVLFASVIIFYLCHLRMAL